ncbi:MAG: GGDEF domain-containing protein [Lachnospiraceae bacterium]|nr:GGDEF domain-containing protein [Lachnospiraceae bacterium]
MRTFVTQDEQKRLSELEMMKKSLELQLQEMAKTVEAQQEQIAMARRDPLTGLRNRAGVAEQINAILKAGGKGAFFIMDMDNFKAVNDTYGHIEGDKVLVRFAKALRKSLEPGDLAARLGGDEFILFTQGEKDRTYLKEKASAMIRQIERELVSPGRLVRVTVSMGIALAPQDGITFEALYGNGDKALYFVKNDGKNGFRFFDETSNGKEKKDAPKASLAEIKKRLREKKMEGSFVVEYNNFEKIYRFMERNIAREKREVQCVLFTVEEPVDRVMGKYEMQRQMEILEQAVTSSLRKGDVTTNYSSCQMLTLLMDVNKKNASMVINRILEKYKKEIGEDALTINCEVEQLMPDEELV